MHLRPELNELCALVEGTYSNPLLIVGDRGSGKTYLMQALRDRQEWNSGQIRYITSYLDAGDVTALQTDCDQEGFWRAALRPVKQLLERPEGATEATIRHHYTLAEAARFAHASLEDLLEVLRTARIKLLLLIDRFSHMLHLDRLREDFWCSLRSIVSKNFSSLAFVAASVHSRELLDNAIITKSDASSPFLNLLANRPLHPLQQSTVNRLLDQADMRIHDDSERRFIYKFAGGNLRFTIELRNQLCWLPSDVSAKDRIPMALKAFWDNGKGWCESIWRTWCHDERAMILRVALTHLQELASLGSSQSGRRTKSFDVYRSPKFKLITAKLFSDMLQPHELREMLQALNISESDIAINDSLPSFTCANNVVEHLSRRGYLEDAIKHLYNIRHRRRQELQELLISWNLPPLQTGQQAHSVCEPEASRWANGYLTDRNGWRVRPLLLLQWISAHMAEGNAAYNHSFSTWLQLQVPNASQNFLDWCDFSFQSICHLLPIAPHILITYALHYTESN